MGELRFTRSLYASSLSARGYDSDKVETIRSVTNFAEQKANSTGKLDPLVDPAGYNVIRLSLPRVSKHGDQYVMNVGTPMPIETRVDTTGSMGGNVDVALRVLPNLVESLDVVLEGYDIHICTGIFGDVCDRFPLCRPQFEMQAEKIVNQLTLMAPQRQGGDAPEDPDLGIFGGAYLCRHYINQIGLKGYDFTVTDAPGRSKIHSDQLIRVYGDKVFEKCDLNGHSSSIYVKDSLNKPLADRMLKNGGEFDTSDVWFDLLKRAHAFVIVIESDYAVKWWKKVVGNNNVIFISDINTLPTVQALIIGLTEGTIELNDAKKFLTSSNINSKEADCIVKEVSNIPLKAQANLPNFGLRPKKGDVFAGKPDVWTGENIWPIGSSEVDSDENNWV